MIIGDDLVVIHIPKTGSHSVQEVGDRRSRYMDGDYERDGICQREVTSDRQTGYALDLCSFL